MPPPVVADSEFWTDARKRISAIRAIDKQFELVFGSQSHRYRIAKTVSERRIKSYEAKHQIELPHEYRLFLKHFGAGGPGPYYGVREFSKVESYGVAGRLEITESTPWPDNDDDPLWNLPGLLYLATEGCAIDRFIEINGPQPGTMWVDAGPGSELAKGDSFGTWYAAWLDRIERGLEQYEILRTLADQDATVQSMKAAVDAEAYEFTWDDVPYIGFRDVPGRIRYKGNTVVGFDVGTNWIT